MRGPNGLVQRSSFATIHFFSWTTWSCADVALGEPRWLDCSLRFVRPFSIRDTSSAVNGLPISSTASTYAESACLTSERGSGILAIAAARQALQLSSQPTSIPTRRSPCRRTRRPTGCAQIQPVCMDLLSGLACGPSLTSFSRTCPNTTNSRGISPIVVGTQDQSTRTSHRSLRKLMND